jgi:hypothetical protein
MAWTTLLDELPLTASWQTVPESEFSLYRFSYVSGDLGINGKSHYEVGQFDTDGSGYNLRTYRTEQFGHIVILRKPQFFDTQRLGFRVPAGFNPFVLKVEVNDMPLFNVGNPSSASATTKKVVNYSVTEVVLVDASPDRKMVSIQNSSNRILYIDFDGAVTTTDFGIPIPANAIYEQPVGFTGEIRGIWATGGSGSARIIEYL